MEARLLSGPLLRSGVAHQPHREAVCCLDGDIICGGARNLAVALGAEYASGGELVPRRLNYAVASGAVGHESETMGRH